jgi:hypothetical protein
MRKIPETSPLASIYCICVRYQAMVIIYDGFADWYIWLSMEQMKSPALSEILEFMWKNAHFCIYSML